MVAWLVWLRRPVRRRALGVRDFLGRILCHVGRNVVPFEIVWVEGCCRAAISGRPRLHGFGVREFLPAVNEEQRREQQGRPSASVRDVQDGCCGMVRTSARSSANSTRPGSERTG